MVTPELIRERLFLVKVRPERFQIVNNLIQQMRLPDKCSNPIDHINMDNVHMKMVVSRLVMDEATELVAGDAWITLGDDFMNGSLDSFQKRKVCSTVDVSQ